MLFYDVVQGMTAIKYCDHLYVDFSNLTFDILDFVFCILKLRLSSGICLPPWKKIMKDFIATAQSNEVAMDRGFHCLCLMKM